MRVLQEYNTGAVMSDVIARGWRIADVYRAANVVRKKQKLPALSYDAVARFLRGESHNPPVAVAVAIALEKTEEAYRQTAPTPKRRTAAAR